MTPNNVAKETTLSFAYTAAHPLPPAYAKRPPVEPLTPDSVVNYQPAPTPVPPPPPAPAPIPVPYQFQWAMDPYHPYQFLQPPKFTMRSRLWAVEFRIASGYKFNSTVIFRAKVHPAYNQEFHLACERITTNEWARTVMFIPHPGVYAIDVTVEPTNPKLPRILCRHPWLTTVFKEGDVPDVPLGGFEHKVLFGSDHNRQAQARNVVTTESNEQSSTKGIRYQEKAHVHENDDFLLQWLRLTPEPEG